MLPFLASTGPGAFDPGPAGDFRALPETRAVGTRSGSLEFLANGYPTETTVADVRAEMDYQRAVQAYLQLLPAVGVMQ